MTSLSIIAEKVKDAVFQLFSSGQSQRTGNRKRIRTNSRFLRVLLSKSLMIRRYLRRSDASLWARGRNAFLVPNGGKMGVCYAIRTRKSSLRRALVRWMHEEIFKASTASSPKTSVFVRDACTKMFKLKGNVKLHFFISQPPCGDAAVFRVVKKEKEKEEEEEEEEEEEILQKDTKGRGLKRVKRGHPGVTGAKIVALSDNKEDVATYNINAEFGYLNKKQTDVELNPVAEI